ncbi:hypothetical protein T08_7843 [Trichinella sp. T8]|nr:hypothetical protein T08_7843 [Trichinella sp. T8]
MCDYTGLVSFLPHHFLICPAFIVSRMIPNSTGSNLRQPKKPNNPPNSTVSKLFDVVAVLVGGNAMLPVHSAFISKKWQKIMSE